MIIGFEILEIQPRRGVIRLQNYAIPAELMLCKAVY